MSGPLPVVLPGGDVVIPASLLPLLDNGPLQAWRDLCAGRSWPTAAKRPRIHSDLVPFFDAVNAAARAYAGRPRHLSVTRIDTRQAARMLGTSPQIVRRWCRSGVLDAVKAGRDWQVDVASIDRRLAHGGPSTADRVRRAAG